MNRKNLIEVSKWKISIGIIGTIVAFLLSNFWSYSSGQNSNRSLLIDTLSKYNDFYIEVRKNEKTACENGQLRGLYLSRFNSMLPVIQGEIKAPYDTPCPLTPLALKPPTLTGIEFNTKWESWDEFKSNPNPHMTFALGKLGILAVPLDEDWKIFITKWRNDIIKRIEEGTMKCPSDRPCIHTLVKHPKENKEERRKKKEEK
ncbi:MAG: hypothetical protein OQL06_10690 [Gammaproteobacteria bacterium]|nr:hypothetical protein [Gammaproteobacteria bacterium]